jgi:uncharacterized membrane protein YfcA
MMIETLLLLSLFVALAYVVKGIAGFGEGMVFITLALLFLDIKLILPVAAVLMLFADFYMIYRTRRDADKRVVAMLAVPVTVGVLGGSYALSVMDAGTLRMLVGILVILFSVNMLRGGRDWKLRKRFSGLLCSTAGFFGGLSDGLFGMGGPPIVMYLRYAGLEKAAFRATAVMAFLVYHVFRLVGYSYFGIMTLDSVRMGALLVPGMIIGAVIGMKVHGRLDEAMFSKVVAIILMVAGVALLF